MLLPLFTAALVLAAPIQAAEPLLQTDSWVIKEAPDAGIRRIYRIGSLYFATFERSGPPGRPSEPIFAQVTVDGRVAATCPVPPRGGTVGLGPLTPDTRVDHTVSIRLLDNPPFEDSQSSNNVLEQSFPGRGPRLQFVDVYRQDGFLYASLINKGDHSISCSEVQLTVSLEGRSLAPIRLGDSGRVVRPGEQVTLGLGRVLDGTRTQRIQVDLSHPSPQGTRRAAVSRTFTVLGPDLTVRGVRSFSGNTYVRIENVGSGPFPRSPITLLASLDDGAVIPILRRWPLELPKGRAISLGVGPWLPEDGRVHRLDVRIQSPPGTDMNRDNDSAKFQIRGTSPRR